METKDCFGLWDIHMQLILHMYYSISKFKHATEDGIIFIAMPSITADNILNLMR